MALGSISADVRHTAAPPAPRRSPPALGVPWGHVPPIWRPGGPCRRPHHARFGRRLGRQAWSAAALGGQIWVATPPSRSPGGSGQSPRPRGSLGVTGAAWPRVWGVVLTSVAKKSLQWAMVLGQNRSRVALA